MRYLNPKDRYDFEVLNENFREIDEKLTTLSGGTTIWLLPNSSSEIYDPVLLESLVGPTTPSIDTVRVGDMVICGLDGGVMYINRLTKYFNTDKDCALLKSGEVYLKGKSAYEYAQEGGFSGSEAEFTAKLAAL